MAFLQALDRDVTPLVDALNYRERRHAAISANVANADTPAYRAVDLEFRSALRRAGLGLRTSHPAHRPGTRSPPRDRLVLSGGAVRNDGNDVDVDREMVKLAQNQLEFQFFARALAGKFRRVKEAITGRAGL